ncbi:hypothetical protein [Dactylosporangium sp. NPDC049140]|uniref:hypothetical protein n=1 Tax=Dactylosporangium sp. NPDC049140 TaxID=3155647 RepID=UPI0033F51FA2
MWAIHHPIPAVPPDTTHPQQHDNNQKDSVALFGAEVNRTGWSELGPTFDWLATRFTGVNLRDVQIAAA